MIQMKHQLEQVGKHFTIREGDISNIYLFGSKMYKTIDCWAPGSDWDFIVVVRSELYYFDGSILIEGDLKIDDERTESLNVNIYHIDYFLHLLKEHYIWVLMLCYLKEPFSDRSEFVWKEDFPLEQMFYYPIQSSLVRGSSNQHAFTYGIGGFNLVKFKNATLTDVSHHVAKAKRLWIFEGDFRRGAKNLLHAVRFMGLSRDVINLHYMSNSEIIDIIEKRRSLDCKINYSYGNDEWENLLIPYYMLAKNIEEHVMTNITKCMVILEENTSNDNSLLKLIQNLRALIESNAITSLEYYRTKAFEILEVVYKERISEEMHDLFHFTYINSNIHSSLTNVKDDDRLVIKKNVSSSKMTRGNRSKKKVLINNVTDPVVSEKSLNFKPVFDYIEKKGIEALNRDFSISLHHIGIEGSDVILCVVDKAVSPIWAQYITTEDYLVTKATNSTKEKQEVKVVPHEVNICQYFSSMVVKSNKNGDYELLAVTQKPMIDLFIDDGLENDLIVGSIDLDFSSGTLITEKVDGISVVLFPVLGEKEVNWVVFSPEIQTKQRFSKDNNWNLGVYKRIDSLFSKASALTLESEFERSEVRDISLEQSVVRSVFWKTFKKMGGQLPTGDLAQCCYTFELLISSETLDEEEHILKSVKFHSVDYHETKLVLHGAYIIHNDYQIQAKNIFQISKEINIPPPRIFNDKFLELFSLKDGSTIDVRQFEDNVRKMLRKYLSPMLVEGLVISDTNNGLSKMFQMIHPQLKCLRELVNINFHTNNMKTNWRFCFNMYRINEEWFSELISKFSDPSDIRSESYKVSKECLELIEKIQKYFETLCGIGLELFNKSLHYAWNKFEAVHDHSKKPNLLKKEFIDHIDMEYPRLKGFIVKILDHCVAQNSVSIYCPKISNEDDVNREALVGIREFFSSEMPARIQLVSSILQTFKPQQFQ